MATPKEIHRKLLKDISDDMPESSHEYQDFICYLNDYVSRRLRKQNGKLLNKLDSMASKGYLGIGKYKDLEKVADLSGNDHVKELIEETKQKLRALGLKKVRKWPWSKRGRLKDYSDDSSESGKSVHSVRSARSVRSVRSVRSIRSIRSADSGSYSDCGLSLGGSLSELQLIQTYPDTDAFPRTTRLFSSRTTWAEEPPVFPDSQDVSEYLFDEEQMPIWGEPMSRRRIGTLPQQHDDASDSPIQMLIPEVMHPHDVKNKDIVEPEQTMSIDDEDYIVDLFEKVSNPLELNKSYIQFGSKSSLVIRMCDIVCVKIKNTADDIKFVWPGYKFINENAERSITFVAVTDNRNRDYTKVLGFDVLFCKENTCNDEAWIIQSSQHLKKKKPFTRRELKQLQQCFTEYSPKLMSSHSNIEIITACSVKSRHFRENDGGLNLLDETCIVLYVHVKGIVPLQEEVFPKQVWGFPVDVREGCFMLFDGPNEYHATLKMGCAIGRDPQHGNNKKGTLGAFIEHNDVNYCLTSAHVLLSDLEMAEVEQAGGRKSYYTSAIGVHQPARNPPQATDRFGDLFEVYYDTGSKTNTGMEIAVVKIQHRDPVDGHFPEGNFEHAGPNASQPMVFNSGEIMHPSDLINGQGTMDLEVVMYGCASKGTKGKFALVGTSVRKRYAHFPVGGFKVELHGQIEIHNIGNTTFAEPGDSGALVFGFFDSNKSYPRPVGILTGCTTDGVAIITPISDILAMLGVNKLKCFPSSHPEPMSGINSDNANQHFDTTLDTMRKAIEENVKTDLEVMNRNIERKIEAGRMEMKGQLEKMQNDMMAKMEEMFIHVMSNSKK